MSYKEPREPSEMPEFYDPEHYKGRWSLSVVKDCGHVEENNDWLWFAQQEDCEG